MARMPSSPRAGEHVVRVEGFTLVELSVTLAVLSLMAAIALPSLRDFRARQQANATMTLLVSHFASARMTAIAQGVPVVVCPSDGAGQCRKDADWGGHWLSFRDPDGNRQPDEDIDIYRNDTVPSDPHIRIFSTQGRKQVRYQSSGMSYGTNLTIRICHDGRIAGSVVLNNTGRARTVRGNLSTPC
ncbi:GspH/FimT family pseudopilin [Pseudoxanthomonas sp. PXM02]|jgi:type IV fimbrial biogenesis protein FimT|uniref:GspH/FimT family pseudopilin n=1 Tax=Pseudoxanthomonas sp. PXM02 TaxID=2769294 RepID=UPI001784D13C|nr:GspH/FimT family pseudopilin [Pseudoxanthomonas sp. PXM02]MBD9479670.1 GspH/FimT family pseudopilin [Pseudoxanthomonas sp. PXM02]